MKRTYSNLILALGAIALIVGCIIFLTPLGEHSRLGAAIQVVGIFVALVASVIALSVADPEKRFVKINHIEPYIDTDTDNIGTYPQKSLTGDLIDKFKDFSDPVVSHRLYFEMTNQSDFVLKKPTLTFLLPDSKRHPAVARKKQTLTFLLPNAMKQPTQKTKKDDVYSEFGFNSNMFNYQRDLVTLAFEDTVILANNILPYWNDNYTVKMWIRMVLDDGLLEPFIVEVSVNCENAEGLTQEVQIDPKKLFEQLDANSA